MTDEQIEQALKHCSILDTSIDACPGCPLDGVDYCITKLAENALALIKRQRARIDNLIDECGKQGVLWRDHFESIYETTKEIIKAEARSEAIRKFASLLKCCASERDDELIDELVRKMTEEQK